MHRRPSRFRAVVAVTTALVVAGAAPAAVGHDAGHPAEVVVTDRGTYIEHTGTIEGARFRALVPEQWNGTLVLYAHGYLPQHLLGGFELPHTVTNNPLTEQHLVDAGYALAGSWFQGDGWGYTLPEAVDDQTRLLDWFDDAVGRPGTTIASGQSYGGAIAALHAQRDRRIDGVLGISATFDPVGTWDAALDMQHAALTLLFPDGTDAAGNPIELVRPTDPATTHWSFLQESAAHLATPEGRARLALAASLAQVPAWWDLGPRPTTTAARAEAMAQWVVNAAIAGHGPLDRAAVEATLGGNPSTNVGVDYRDLFRHSAERATVKAAYAEAGLDLRADLHRLNAGTRYVADDEARARMLTHVPFERLDVPVLTIHTTGDGGAFAADVRAFTEHQRNQGADVRNLWLERAGHPYVSAAEEVVAVGALERRAETGRWGRLSPRSLNAAATALPRDLGTVWDFVSQLPVEPAFVRYQPPHASRSSF